MYADVFGLNYRINTQLQAELQLCTMYRPTSHVPDAVLELKTTLSTNDNLTFLFALPHVHVDEQHYQHFLGIFMQVLLSL